MADDGDKKGAEAVESEGGGLNWTAVGIVAAVLAVGGVALAYFFHLISDQVVGGLLAGGYTLVLALLAARVALETVRLGVRYGIFAYVLAFAFAALYPAAEALHLGRPSASGVLSESSRELALPSSGAYRLLVSGKLGEGRDPRISYRLKAGEQTVDGALTREYAVARTRRGSMQVPEDHDLQAHEVSVSGAPAGLKLDQLTGATEVRVQAFRVIPEFLIWGVMVLVLIAGMFLESKVSGKGAVVMTGAAAVSFGLIIKTATPTNLAVATLWGAALAAGGGAILGSILNSIGKKVFGVADDAVTRGKEKAAARKAKEADEED